MGRNGDQANNYYLGSTKDQSDNHYYQNGSKYKGSNGEQTNNYYLGTIRIQEDNEAGNQTGNISNHMGNAWYRVCHSVYWRNFGQNCCNLYNLQHGQKMTNYHKLQ